MKILIAQINPTVGDFKGNRRKSSTHFNAAKKNGPTSSSFLKCASQVTLLKTFSSTPNFSTRRKKASRRSCPILREYLPVLGTIRKEGRYLFNSAAVLAHGKQIGFQDKALLPTYDVFDEKRYFQPTEAFKLFTIAGKKVAITICEDLWQHSGELKNISYARDPVLEIAELNPDLVLNLSASPYHINKFVTRMKVASKAAKTIKKPLLLCNQSRRG